MYNRILVAIDGSETSNKALKEAISLAREQRSTLRLVHVVDVAITYASLGGPYVAEYQRALQAAGGKVIADCSAIVRDAGVQFDAISIVLETPYQHVYEAIENEAKQWRADLIVIGTHGRRGLGRLFLGSVAEGLTRVASKPVLLVRGT